MIQKIEFYESNLVSEYISIDFSSNKLLHYVNEEEVKNKTVILNKNIFNDLLSTHIMNWDSSYISGSTSTDITKANLKITFADGIQEYNFLGKFPTNYMDFKDELKRLVDML